MRYDHAYRATVGARSRQEDWAAVVPVDRAEASEEGGDAAGDADQLIAVLADGMGGHVGGAVASEIACLAFLEVMSGLAGHPAPRLAGALEAANDAIASAVQLERDLRGMGTTLVGLVVRGDAMSWISVGDSPLFVWRRGQIAQINEDHSLAPMLEQMVAEGRLTPEAAAKDGRRHMLRSVLIGEPLELIDASQRPLALEQDDCVVLASDGIDTLEDSRIAEVLARHRSDGAAAVAEALLEAIENAGVPHQDNTTVIVICAEADQPAASAGESAMLSMEGVARSESSSAAV